MWYEGIHPDFFKHIDQAIADQGSFPSFTSLITTLMWRRGWWYETLAR